MVVDIPYGLPFVSYMRDDSPLRSQRLMCMWPLDPVQVWSGLAMKVSP